MMSTEQAYHIRRIGDRFEIRVMNRVKAGAVFCQRTAGSKGLADIMAVMPSGRIRLIQAKANGYLAPAERAALTRLWGKLPRNTQLEVFWAKSPRKLGRKVITDPSQLAMFATRTN